MSTDNLKWISLLLVPFFLIQGAWAYDACDYRGEVMPAARTSIENRIIRIQPKYGVPNIDFSEGVDWESYNDATGSFRWWLNTMKTILPAIANDPAPTEASLSGALALVHDWIKENPQNDPASNFAWDNHATAKRSQYLACLHQHFPDDVLLKNSIADHAEYLADPERYEGPWNHGLDQDIGLLAIGCVTDNEEWKKAAATRMENAVAQMVDEQGASSEQATGYHVYAYSLLTRLQEKLNACEVKYPEKIFKTVDKMPDFLRHATSPDGTLSRLGDTTLRNAPEYAREGGEKLNPVAVYDAGYVFGRSGWDESDSYYTIRFGPQRMIHGHNDHTSLTYFTHGKRFLIDGGFHGYTKDKWRAFFRNPEAHNVVVTSGQARFLWTAETSLKSHVIEDTWQSYVLADKPYHRTERQRSIFISQEPELIVIIDFLSAYKPREYAQLWRFDSGMSVTLNDSVAEITDGEFKAVMKQQWSYDKVNQLQGDTSPLQGWAGLAHYQIAAVPVISTIKKGKSVGYLTVFAFDLDPEDLVITEQPYRVGDAIRKISVKTPNQNIALTFKQGGLLIRDE